MIDERRTFLKATLGAAALGVGTLLAAQGVRAAQSESTGADSNGVVLGHSPKKEVLYRKTANWEAYYKAVY